MMFVGALRLFPCPTTDLERLPLTKEPQAFCPRLGLEDFGRSHRAIGESDCACQTRLFRPFLASAVRLSSCLPLSHHLQLQLIDINLRISQRRASWMAHGSFGLPWSSILVSIVTPNDSTEHVSTTAKNKAKKTSNYNESISQRVAVSVCISRQNPRKSNAVEAIPNSLRYC